MKNSTTVRAFRLLSRATATIAPPLAARWFERLFLTPRRFPTPKREAEWLASARRSKLQFDEHRSLPLYIWGDGPVVLLAHGWSGRGSQMAGFAQALVHEGFQVIAFDAPGHGQADGNRSSLPEVANTIEHVAEAVGPVHAIVAHSLGTAASTIALSRGLPVQKLVYVAPPENPGDYLYRIARFLGFGDAIARRTQARIEKRYDYPFELCRGSTLAAELDIPLLVVHDLDDRDVPHEDAVRLVEAWPGARLMTTSGLGHHRILRTEKVIRAAADFLKPASPQPVLPAE